MPEDAKPEDVQVNRAARCRSRPHLWAAVGAMVISAHAGVCRSASHEPGVEPATQDTAVPATLGAHTLLWQENFSGVSPAVTDPVTTQASGSSFIVFNAGFASNDTPPTDNKNNAWVLLGEPVVYDGYGGAFDVKAYLSLQGHGGAGHRVSIVKNGTAEGEITIPFIEIRDGAVLQDWAQNYALGGTTNVSASVTTTGPAVLVAFWWGDGDGLQHSAVPDNGFSIIENFVDLPAGSAVQCVVAAKEVDAAGTYRVSWSVSPAQGAPLWLFAFQGPEEEVTDRVFEDGFDP